MALTQISTGGLKDDAVTDAKLPANSVGNSEMKDDAVGVAELSASGTAGNTTFLRGDNTWATPADTNTQLSTEQVQDIVGAMFTGNTETNITATYEDGDGTIDLVATAGETNRMPLAGGTFTGDVTFDNQSTGGRDIIWDESDDALEFLDNTKATFGNDGDLKIYHNGTDNYIMPSNGKLIINNGSETLAQFVSDGTVELYHNGVKKLNTDSGGIEVVGAVMPSGNISMVDSAELKIGTSDDLKIYHDGTYNWIDAVNNHGTVLRAGTGILYLQGSEIHMGDEGGNEVHIKTIDNGAVELYYDNAKKFNTAADGATVTGSLFCSEALQLNDSKKIELGTGQDLQIFYNGSDGFIKQPVGTMWTETPAWCVTSATGSEYMARFDENGSCKLYYDNSAKIETISTGINVTGGVRIGGNNTANEMDDYEEGTWTPDFGNFTSLSFNSRTGVYTKVGRLVYASAHFNVASRTGGGGHMLLTGLPFTSHDTNASGNGFIGYSAGLTGDTYDVPTIYMGGNATQAYFYKGNGSTFASQDMDMSSGSLHVTLIYEAA